MSLRSTSDTYRLAVRRFVSARFGPDGGGVIPAHAMADFLDSLEPVAEATVATDDDSLVARVGMMLHDEGFAVSVDTVKQIVKTILDNKAALDFLGRM